MIKQIHLYQAIKFCINSNLDLDKSFNKPVFATFGRQDIKMI